MKYCITVHELIADPTGATVSTAEVFKQQVETIDLGKVFAAVNVKPRKPRRSTTAPTGK